MKLLLAHAPHIVFVALGVAAFLWTAYRKSPEADASRAAPPRDMPPVVPSAVRRSTARRGLLALGPLLGALATGAILYGVNLGGDRAPGSLIWIHSGISVLAMLLVCYKLRDLRRAPLRRALTAQRLSVLASVSLAALSVPLMITGAALLLAPRGGSFAAYAHIVASAWWTALLCWHLRRYVGASLRALAGPPDEALATR